MSDKKGLSYQDAGVDIEKADALVGDIKTIAKRTRRPGVMSSIGGFGGLFEIPVGRFKNPVLVSGTDGVGTKLKLAVEMGQHDTLGIDLVAMCANDIVTLGAEPLYFLDYFATSALDPAQAKAVLTGIGQGCEQAGAALIGGETAEMPGVYQKNDYDLAGFCVGIVEKSEIIDSTQVRIGDVLVALGSSGPHSNGYSLIRKILQHGDTALDTPFEDTTLGRVLLTPTRIYVKTLLKLIKAADIHGIAHITGGGLLENIPRILPANTRAIIDTDSWTWPAIFQWLQQQGNVATDEMCRTFNVGVGMVLCVSESDAEKVVEMADNFGENAWKIGHIEKSDQAQPHVVMD